MLTNAPLAGDLNVAQRFGDRPVYFQSIVVEGVALRGHDGLDLATPIGTPVLAVQTGEALSVIPDHPRFGQTVVLAHEWGQSIYAHLSQLKVAKGAAVQAGQTIGLSGTAPGGEGAHLHFGLRIQPFALNDGWGGYSDPKPYLDRLTEPRGAIIGPHIIGGIQPHLDLLRQWQPRLITVLDPNPDEMVLLRAACRQAVIIGRIFVADADVEARIRADPEAAAEWAHHLTMARMTAHVDYWQVANEVLANVADLPLLARFEIRRMQLATASMYSCAIFAFAVGNPDLPESDRMGVWRLLYPALELAEMSQHVVAVHQYGVPDLWQPYQDWYGYRLEHQILNRLPFKQLQFAVTEYGIDGLIAGGEPRGWQRFVDAAGYAGQLLRSGRYLERFSGRVLGYSAFTLGHNNPWQTYDIAGPVAQTLAEQSQRGTWLQVQTEGTGLRPADTNPTGDLGSNQNRTSMPDHHADKPTRPATPDQGTTSMTTTTVTVPGTSTVARRLTDWFDDLRLSIAAIEQRPDHPSGDIVYVIKDVFTTRNGSWDVTSDPYALPQWAKDSYLAGFSKAYERNSLYAAVLGLDGQFVYGQELRFWTGGVDKLTDLGSTTNALKQASEQPGWAVMLMYASSAYDPTAGQSGPWCWTPNGMPGEVLCGGGLPSNGQDVSTFVVWQAVHKGEVVNPPTPTPTPEPTPTPTPGPTPTPTIERRLGSWVAALNLKVKRIEDRPDQVPSADVVYLLKDIFTTANGSWENQGAYGAVDQSARDAYLKPVGDPEYFDDAGADHHLFAAILDVNGKLIKNADMLYWSDGFAMLGDPNYDGYVMGSLGARYPRTKDKSGWANIPMDPGSSYGPDRGESGPWCWAPSGLLAEVMCGGGMPLKNHISMFAVWQAVPRSQIVVTQPPLTGDYRIFMPSIMSGGVVAPAAAPSPAPVSRQPDAAIAEVIRSVAWGRLGLDYRPGAALAEYARRMGLGAPLTNLFEAAGYVAQGFHGGIVLASMADTGEITYVPW